MSAPDTATQTAEFVQRIPNFIDGVDPVRITFSAPGDLLAHPYIQEQLAKPGVTHLEWKPGVSYLGAYAPPRLAGKQTAYLERVVVADGETTRQAIGTAIAEPSFWQGAGAAPVRDEAPEEAEFVQRTPQPSSIDPVTIVFTSPDHLLAHTYIQEQLALPGVACLKWEPHLGFGNGTQIAYLLRVPTDADKEPYVIGSALATPAFWEKHAPITLRNPLPSSNEASV